MTSLLEKIGFGKGVVKVDTTGEVVVVHQLQGVEIVVASIAGMFLVWAAGKAMKVW